MDLFTNQPQLTSERLILRPMTEEDVHDLFAVFSDEQVTAHYDLYTFRDLEEAYSLIDYFNESYEVERQVRWGICRKQDNRLIGTCGFVALYEHKAEIGYELGSEFWHQGYMTEALTLLLRLAFNQMELNRIEALVMPANAASARLLTRLGFQEEGTLREYDFFKESFQDLRSFSLLYREYMHRDPTVQDTNS